MESANKKDMRRLSQNVYTTPNPEPSDYSKPQSQDSDGKRRYSLKKSICNACMEKIKEPLPVPKTPRIKKNCVPVLDTDTYKQVKTDSTHRISQMINKEYVKANSRRNSRSSSIASGRLRRDSDRERFLQKYALDTVDLNELDLAKIKQEIKEKETKKKLENFFQNKI